MTKRTYDLPKRPRDDYSGFRHLTPLGYRVVAGYSRELRRRLKAAVRREHGQTTEVDDANISAAIRYEELAQIALRKIGKADAISPDAKLLLAIADLTERRDRAIARLRLDKSVTAGPDLFATVQPVIPAVAHQDAPAAAPGDDAGPVEDLFMAIGDEQHGHVGDQDGGAADPASAIVGGAGQPSYATHANTPPSFSPDDR